MFEGGLKVGGELLKGHFLGATKMWIARESKRREERKDWRVIAVG